MEGLVPRNDDEDVDEVVARMSAAERRDRTDRTAVAFFCRLLRLHGRPPIERDVVAVATDRPSHVAMVTTVPLSSSSAPSPSKLGGWAMNMNSSQSSWIDGGHRLRLRRRCWLLLLLLLEAEAPDIRLRGLLRLLLLICAFFWWVRSFRLDPDRGDAAAESTGADDDEADGPSRAVVATVTVSSDEHEHASSLLSTGPAAAAAGNIIFSY